MPCCQRSGIGWSGSLPTGDAGAASCGQRDQGRAVMAMQSPCARLGARWLGNYDLRMNDAFTSSATVEFVSAERSATPVLCSHPDCWQ
jgi:hypothetical protein